MNYSLIKIALQPELDKLESLINSNITAVKSKLISNIANHIISSGGKRLRPFILLLMAKMFDYTGSNHIKLAAVLEIIHSATLLHDDVIDNSDMRRNKLSAHKKWGMRNSITVGDWLFSLAFNLTVSCHDNRLTTLIAQMTKAMAQGELTQLSYKTNKNITEQAYFSIIEAKTGLLFAAATELAACLSHQNDTIIENAKLYGLYMGLAFQIKDDLLDYLGDVNVMGKNVGDDLLEGKVTLPMIYLKQRDSKKFFKIMTKFESLDRTLQHNVEIFNLYFAELKIALELNNCIEDSLKLAAKQQSLALDYLNKLPGNQYKKYLYDITNEILVRSN